MNINEKRFRIRWRKTVVTTASISSSSRTRVFGRHSRHKFQKLLKSQFSNKGFLRSKDETHWHHPYIRHLGPTTSPFMSTKRRRVLQSDSNVKVYVDPWKVPIRDFYDEASTRTTKSDHSSRRSNRGRNTKRSRATAYPNKFERTAGTLKSSNTHGLTRQKRRPEQRYSPRHYRRYPMNKWSPWLDLSQKHLVSRYEQSLICPRKIWQNKSSDSSRSTKFQWKQRQELQHAFYNWLRHVNKSWKKIERHQSQTSELKLTQWTKWQDTRKETDREAKGSSATGFMTLQK